MLNLAKFTWSVKEHTDEELLLNELQEAGLDFSSAFLCMCIRRGLTSKEAILAATNRDPTLYHDPFLMYQMDRAIQRIERAVESGEKIVIYGDYDADGITSTLILYEGLKSIGANVSYFLPNRLIEGYGPNLERYRQIIDEGATLIITCDNGVAGHEAIEFAQSQNVDVIVTDHHQIQETLPDAYAIIHPAHPNGDYPFHELSGAGVALKLMSALLEETPPEWLELAAIGTVADMMPMVNENRTIVLAGLQQMQQTNRIGLHHLLSKASVQSNQIDAQTIGFVIGPRLNAVGRLGDPSPGLELLATHDMDEATSLVTFINQQNNERKQIEQQIMAEVDDILNQDDLPDIIIQSSDQWAAGVLGITAGKIARKYHRPTILLQKKDDTLVGSGRSIEGVDLFELLKDQASLLEHYGGHNQAAGLTISEENYPMFTKQLMKSMEDYQEQIDQLPTLIIDLELKPDDITLSLVEEFQSLAPYGMGNPEPLIKIETSVVQQCRLIGTNKEHLKLSLTHHDDPKNQLQLIGFYMGEQGKQLQAGQQLSVVGTLTINEWNNLRIPQLQLEDFGVNHALWIDCRGSKVRQELLGLKDSLFVFQHQTIAQIYQAQISDSSEILLYNDTVSEITPERLVIMEPPQDISHLSRLFEQFEFQEVYLGSYIQSSKYLAGLPTREQTIKCYQWIQKQQPFPVRKNLNKVSQLLAIHPTLLSLMITMFYEAGFISIEDGILTPIEQTSDEKVTLPTLPSYKKYQSAMEAEAILNYQPIERIQKLMEG